MAHKSNSNKAVGLTVGGVLGRVRGRTARQGRGWLARVGGTRLFLEMFVWCSLAGDPPESWYRTNRTAAPAVTIPVTVGDMSAPSTNPSPTVVFVIWVCTIANCVVHACVVLGSH